MKLKIMTGREKGEWGGEGSTLPSPGSFKECLFSTSGKNWVNMSLEYAGDMGV